MGLLGALIGGGIGFMVGGPLGAIFGGAIGSNFGDGGGRMPHPGARTGGRPRINVNYGRTGPGEYGYGPRGYDPLQAQQAFLVAMISLAAKVAKADGRVTPEEVRSFDNFLQYNLKMPIQDRKVAAHIFNEARDSNIPAEEFARQIRTLLGHQPERMRDLITLLTSVALADGHLHPAEDALIRSIAATLGLSDRQYDEARASTQPGGDLQNAYQILGLDPGASDTELKQAYRRLAKEYHPDVLASKGLGEDFKQFADDKMAAINQAYDQVKEARGI